MSQYVFQSTTTTLGAVLVLELFFDKVYVCIVVFLRPDIISDFTLDISSQIFRHIGLLLPAVLTISDIRDAVALVDHVAGVLHHRRRAGIPESTIASLRKMHEKKYTATVAKFCQKCYREIGSVGQSNRCTIRFQSDSLTV